MRKKLQHNPLISIIIPAYNEEKHIKECLESIKKQTLKDIEIIIIDDGSTDSTKEKVLEMNVKVTSISHGGPGRAKNIGARIAAGKILVFIDADMVLEKSYLQNVISPIINRKCISTYTTAEYVANPYNIWARCWNINADLPVNLRVRKNDVTGGLACRAILKDMFITAKGFNPKLGYIDDRFLGKKLPSAISVNNAKCYHHNPETLKDIFLSARWIGRSANFKRDLLNLIRYSLINSIGVSLHKISEGAPLSFFIFKIVFDFGIITGLLFKNSEQNFAK